MKTKHGGLKQPVHSTDSHCKSEGKTSAPGGPSLGGVMKQKGDTGARPGEKHSV
jgi:hypothetical protein